MYVQKHNRATPCARMLVGGGPNVVLATPRDIPPGVGYGWQHFLRDESRWILQKWEEEEVGKILHPTQSHAETTPSSPCALSPTLPHLDGNSSLLTIASPDTCPASLPPALEELDDHPSAPTETVPPPHALIPPSHHKLEWLIRGMTSWLQCAVP